MGKPLKTKILLIISLALVSSLLLVGCIEKNVNVNELIPESIETMKALDSYSSNVQVDFASESGKVNMNAIITYHKEPFAYSNVQEITSNNQGSDSPIDKLMLSIIAKDGVVYTNNSVTGLWLDETDPKLVKEVEDNGDLFQKFSSDQFTNIEVTSISKNKATITARSTNSNFLKNLLSSFDVKIIGNVEMIIDIKTNQIESFIYYPEINNGSDKSDKITITTKDFNNATEVVVPQEALYK